MVPVSKELEWCLAKLNWQKLYFAASRDQWPELRKAVIDFEKALEERGLEVIRKTNG